ncbi:hypothetical protein GOBAR_DD15062 [Gossypium barbadense]|nr:hypothetical protein GOBAR_DD15062 [Gossypium barbadense]
MAEQKKKAKVKLAIILGTVIAALWGFLLIVCYIRRSRRKFKDEVEDKNLNGREDKDENEDMELAVFEFGTIAQATDSFSFINKLGQGGFGPVYKGTLADGQEIAVKRLSKSSRQGLNEFKNEVKLIAKLQHRNLVRLLGCCMQRDERMLVYEYMPNRSLDLFIFDQTRRTVLTWSKRFQIICGIARGLLYLHQDSRLRIIHRDLKTSNVLLDSEMNPKISDFGMARTFGGDQSEANTNRVVGTYGYMAPEYAIDGVFSVKSDVFSFGILLLELISGKKNRGFYHVNQSGNLIEHAWRLWEEGKPLDLADEFLAETGDLSELLRCIHISLLCIQQHPEERPNMSSVVLMLGSHNELPLPKQPGFLFYKKPFEADCSSGNDGSSSRNEISFEMDSLINPGTHISDATNNEDSYRVIRGRVNGLKKAPDSRLMPYLEQAGFESAALIRTFDLQYDLLSVPLSANATESELMCAARAYIMHILGGVLMPDANNNNVHMMYLPLLADLSNVCSYSWGSAVLAVLYRELYRIWGAYGTPGSYPRHHGTPSAASSSSMSNEPPAANDFFSMFTTPPPAPNDDVGRREHPERDRRPPNRYTARTTPSNHQF